jgi:hypothetical protein
VSTVALVPESLNFHQRPLPHHPSGLSSAYKAKVRPRDNVAVRWIGRLMWWAAGYAIRLILAFALGISPAVIGLLGGHYIGRLYR